MNKTRTAVTGESNAPRVQSVFTKALVAINHELCTWEGSPSFTVVAVKDYDRVYAGHPLDIGTIEIAYHDASVARMFGDSRPNNNHALFGVHADGSVVCQAN